MDTVKIKALLADDNKEIRDLIRISLESNGISVISKQNGVEVLEEIKKDTPDVFILDMDMPQLDGYALIENLKANESWRKIPIIVCTGLIKDSKRSEKYWAGKLGVEVCLSKPFNPLLLADIIKKLVKLR
ncbi:MAG: response regulator [Candidatus Sumerlaeota bacterium]|nr:response regulator [Candidatus Sumerlaeota bacterium]